MSSSSDVWYLDVNYEIVNRFTAKIQKQDITQPEYFFIFTWQIKETWYAKDQGIVWPLAWLFEC